MIKHALLKLTDNQISKNRIDEFMPMRKVWQY